MNYICQVCKKPIEKRPHEGNTIRKFCSQDCFHIYQKSHPSKTCFKIGNHPKTEFKKGNPKPKNAYTFPFGEKHPLWKGHKKIKCLFCKKTFFVSQCRPAKFCSLSCHGKWMSKYNIDDAHPMWKEINFGYYSLHRWIRKKKGNPPKCSSCGKVGKTTQIHWANTKNHKYSRILSDYIPLCASCHKIYDLKI